MVLSSLVLIYSRIHAVQLVDDGSQCDESL